MTQNPEMVRKKKKCWALLWVTDKDKNPEVVKNDLPRMGRFE